MAFHPTNPALLAIAGWDSTCKLFTLTSSAFPSPTTTFTHPNPVLDCSFGAGPHDGKLYTGALDCGVRELDIATGLMSVIGTHGGAVRCVHYSSTINALITGSWDASLAIHDPRSTPSASKSLTIPNLPAKILAMDAVGDKLVVAMSQRKVAIYDVRQLGEALQNDGPPPAPWQERESSLKFMTRAVKCMPDGEGQLLPFLCPPSALAHNELERVCINVDRRTSGGRVLRPLAQVPSQKVRLQMSSPDHRRCRYCLRRQRARISPDVSHCCAVFTPSLTSLLHS